MEKDLLKNEIRKMLQFHKSVLLLIFKTFLCAFRYGLWLLPWILFSVFLWKPVLAGWKAFTQDSPDSGRVRQATVSAPPGIAAEAVKLPGWETIPNKVNSGIRTFERISKNLRKK